MAEAHAATHHPGPGWRHALLLACALFALHEVLGIVVALLDHHHPLDTCHWDCHWYVSIAQHGYAKVISPSTHQADWAFFPLFPLLLRATVAVTGLAAPLAAVLLGKAIFLAAIAGFIVFARAWMPAVSPWHAAIVIALEPYAVYGDAGYTEPLFLLLTCLFFIALRTRRYLLCGACGALLSATRVPGILVALPYALALAGRFAQADARERWAIALGGLLIPLGLALYMLHLDRVTGDALAFAHVQTAWRRAPTDPLSAVWGGLRAGNIHALWALLSLFGVAGGLWLLWTGQVALGAFALACTLLPLSAGLMSMPRYLAWQAPLLLVLAWLLRRRWLRWTLIPLGIAGLAYMQIGWLAARAWTV